MFFKGPFHTVFDPACRVNLIGRARLSGRGQIYAWTFLVLLALTSGSLSAQEATATAVERTAFWGAIGDSFKLLMIEHGTRILFQEQTRRELDGPFWRDYRDSIRWPRRWEDGDPWYVNYVGHTLHGAAAGRIWLDHTALRGAAPTTLSYWPSRGRATAFSALYSLQFEFGPLSEASIGNVGQRPETSGWVDHVVTPLGAFAFLVVEDALDRYVIAWFERHVDQRVARASVRMLVNPSRVLANVAQSRAPWHRDGRPLTLKRR